jgi:hypothetical protein
MITLNEFLQSLKAAGLQLVKTPESKQVEVLQELGIIKKE